MAAVVAARWDIEWDRGGGWWVKLGRRARSGETLALAAPCALEIRPVDTPSTIPPLLTLPGVLDDAGNYFELRASRAQIEALPGSRYEHRILAVDAVRTIDLVLLYGYVAINDTAGDR